MKRSLLIVATLILCGCDALEKAQKAEIAAEQNATDIKKLEKRLSDAELKVWLLEQNKNPFQSAAFDPASNEGYQRLDSSCCSFAVRHRNRCRQAQRRCSIRHAQ